MSRRRWRAPAALAWLAFAVTPVHAQAPQWDWLLGSPDRARLLPVVAPVLAGSDDPILAAVVDDGRFADWATRRLAELRPRAQRDARSWPLLLAAAGNLARARGALAAQRRAAVGDAAAVQELDLLRALVELRGRRTAEAGQFASAGCAEPRVADLVPFCLHVQALIASSSGNRAAAADFLSRARRLGRPVAAMTDMLLPKPRWDRLRAALFDTGRALYGEVWTSRDHDALARRVAAKRIESALQAMAEDGPTSERAWTEVSFLVRRDSSLGEFQRARLWLDTYRDQVIERYGNGEDVRGLKRRLCRLSAMLAADEGDMGAARSARGAVRALSDQSASAAFRAAELFYLADDVDVPFQPELATALFEEVWTWASAQPDVLSARPEDGFDRRVASLRRRPPGGAGQWETTLERQPEADEQPSALLFSSSLRLMLLFAERGDLRQVERYRQAAETSAKQRDLALGGLSMHSVVLKIVEADMIRRYDPTPKGFGEARTRLLEARRQAEQKLRFPEGDPTRLIDAWALVAPKLNRRVDLINTALPVLDAMLLRLDGVLGRIQQAQGNDGEAYRTLESAFRLLIRAYGVGGHTTEQVDIATRLAQLATKSEDQAAAYRWAQEAVGSQSVVNHGTPAFAGVLQARAELFRRAGDFYGAELALQRATAILQPLGAAAGRQLAGVQAAMAGVLLDEGDAAAALLVARPATLALAAVSREDWTADERRGVEVHLLALHRQNEAASRGEQQALLREAFTTAQLLASSRAQQAIESARRREALRDPALEALIQARDEMRRRLAGLDRRFAEAFARPSNSDATLQENSRKYAAIEAELARLTAAIRQSPGEGNRADFAASQPLSLEAAMAALDQGEALFFFNQVGAGALAWVVTRDGGVHWRRVPLDMAAIERRVATLRCGLDRQGWKVDPKRCPALTGAALPASAAETPPLPFRLDAAFELYQALLAPFAQAIAGKSLVIVADGALATVPFAAFLTERPSSALTTLSTAYPGLPWFVRQASTSVLPYVGDLRRLAPQLPDRSRGGTFIGFGDPLLNGRATTLGTGKVVETVAATFQATPNDIFLRENATKAQLAALNASGRLATARVMMFATHALLPGNPTEPEKDLGEPALELTPDPATPAAEGSLPQASALLTASDVAQLSLRADVVILSACNTGGGEKRGDEALSGLARAFFYAGARSMLVSHWEAAVYPASYLMTRTFANGADLQAKGIAGAFKDAQLSMINDPGADEGAAHPENWAVFVVIGRGGIAGLATRDR